MQKKFRWISVLCFLTMVQYIFAQEKEQCMETVRECYAKLSNASEKPVNNKAFYLNYTVDTKMRDSLNNKNHSSIIEMVVGENSAQIISKEINVFQDEKEIFTVVPERKVIYRADAAPLGMKEKRMKKISLFQDTLLDMCKVQNCRFIKNSEGKTMLETELKLNEAARNKFKADKLVFLISSEEKKIEKVTTVNLPEEEIASVTYTINTVNYDYKTSILNMTVSLNLLDNNGNLLPVYKNYTMIDNRAKAKKDNKK